MNLQSNRPSEFQDGRKGLGCSDRARQELTFDVAVPWEFSAFFSYFGERNDGWEKNGWMDGGCFLFPEHFRRPRPLRFPPLSASPTHLDGQTDRKRVSLAQPEVHVLGGHARRMNQMSELFMSCSISGHFVCIQAPPRLTASLRLRAAEFEKLETLRALDLGAESAGNEPCLPLEK